MGTVTLLGAEASEDGLEAALRQQERWSAVHPACHGLIDARRPGLSSLALSRAGEADGFLTALEVLRMEVAAARGSWASRAPSCTRARRG